MDSRLSQRGYERAYLPGHTVVQRMLMPEPPLLQLLLEIARVPAETTLRTRAKAPNIFSLPQNSRISVGTMRQALFLKR